MEFGPDRPFRLGTRRSPLALEQAALVRDALIAAHGLVADAVALVPIVATGDKVQDRALAEIGGKALWTRELDRALIASDIDAAVHSMKDVETARPAALALAALLPRADVRDRLIGADSLAALPHGARIGCASPRRRAQLLRQRPDFNITLLRGNVGTRLAKVAAGEVDATLLAAAGLDRLGLTGTGVALQIEAFLPAPAQGAVGVECRADSSAARRLLAAIDDADTHAAIVLERALLAALGADCHSPVAALAQVAGAAATLTVQLLSEDGAAMVAGTATLAPGDQAGAAALARELLGRAPPALARLFAP